MRSSERSVTTRASSLLDELIRVIAENGPMSVERYMGLVLAHPVHGYYVTRDPFGVAGDFTTAPEISQMFGELLGLWAVEMWNSLGRPNPLRLVELGPGRGTLMADALRAARALPACRAALDVHLVEISPVLRAMQERTLGASGATATWHGGIETLPDGPAIILANEFFDALPIRQFVHAAGEWRERLIGLDVTGQLVFGLAPDAERGLARAAPEGAVLEVCATGQRMMRVIAQRIAAQGGALLAIDYGHAISEFGDTLQAIKAHASVDVLVHPGESDLTAHVDFAALARRALQAGLAVYGPASQGDFLRALGIAERAMSLKRRASLEQTAAINAAMFRLTGPAPGMGDLFKVLAVTQTGRPSPPGFALELPS